MLGLHPVPSGCPVRALVLPSSPAPLKNLPALAQPCSPPQIKSPLKPPASLACPSSSFRPAFFHLQLLLSSYHLAHSPGCSCPMRLSPYPPYLLSGRRSFHPSCSPQAASFPASTLCQPVTQLQLQDPGEEEVYPCVIHSKALAGTQKQIPAAPVRGVAQCRDGPGSSKTEGRHQVASKRATAAPSLGLTKGHRSF